MSAASPDASPDAGPPPATVRVEIDAGIATIRIDRPKMNALDGAIQSAIGAAAEQCATDPQVAAVVITGGPTVFAAGADIKEMAGLGYAEMVARSSALQAAFTALARLPKPTVAAINGYALGGGCELALCADRRVAATDAVLGQPEIKLGVIPGAGGTQRLTRLVGPARAKDLIFTGRFVQAEEALRIGLVDEVVAPHEVYPAAVAWARQFVGGPALALRAAKEAIDLGATVDPATGLEIERQQFAALFATEDRRVGMEAFVAHTTPVFTGR